MTIKFILAVAAVILALSITLLITTTNFNLISAQDTGNSSSSTTTSNKVRAGGGNVTDMLAVFVPQQIQVSTGQSITWDNPSAVAEPHTVTFVLDNKTATELVSIYSNTS